MDPMDSAWYFLKNEGGLNLGITPEGVQPIFTVGTRKPTDYPKITEDYSPEAAQKVRNAEKLMQLLGLGLSANTALEALGDPSNATSSQVIGGAGTRAYTTYSTVDQLTPNLVNRILAGQKTRAQREKEEALEEFRESVRGAGNRTLTMGDVADPTPEEPPAPEDSSHLFNFAEDAEYTEGPEDPSVPLLSTTDVALPTGYRTVNPDEAYRGVF